MVRFGSVLMVQCFFFFFFFFLFLLFTVSQLILVESFIFLVVGEVLVSGAHQKHVTSLARDFSSFPLNIANVS